MHYFDMLGMNFPRGSETRTIVRLEFEVGRSLDEASRKESYDKIKQLSGQVVESCKYMYIDTFS